MKVHLQDGSIIESKFFGNIIGLAVVGLEMGSADLYDIYHAQDSERVGYQLERWAGKVVHDPDPG